MVKGSGLASVVSFGEAETLTPEEQQARRDASLARKQIGKCPFCQKQVQALVIEENTVRRDRCECPECREPLYVCRTPGCHDYAKGTATYDHEFCPDCTTKMSGAAAEVGSAAIKAGGVILAAWGSAKVASKGKGK
jgi:hypothetical protein